MLKAKKYSIWLMPTGEIYKKLNGLIFQLSREYNTPKFEPHVTLFGRILGHKEEVILKTAQLASMVKPYKIELNRVEYLDEYFRCLFLKAKETNKVIKANQEAKKIFSRETDLKYMPHLSLMYGDFTPQIKEKIITEIGKKIPVSFDVDNIHLFSTDSKPQNWRRIKKFYLSH